MVFCLKLLPAGHNLLRTSWKSFVTDCICPELSTNRPTAMTRNSMLFGSRSSTRIKPMFPTGRILHKIMSMMLSLFEEKRAGICYLTMKNQGTKQKMITRPIWVPWQAATNIANIKYFIYLPQLTRPHVRHVHRLLFVLQTFTHIQIKLYKKEFTRFQPDHVLPEKKILIRFFEWPWRLQLTNEINSAACGSVSTYWECKITHTW